MAEPGVNEFVIGADGTAQQAARPKVRDAARSVSLEQLEAAASAEGTQSCLQNVSDVLRQAIDLLATGWFETNATGHLTGSASFAHFLPLAEQPLEGVLSSAAERATSQRATIALDARLQRPVSRAGVRTGGDGGGGEGRVAEEPVLVIGVPIPGGVHSAGVLTGCVRAGATSLERTLFLFEKAAVAIRISRAGVDSLQSDRELAAAAAVIDLTARIESETSLDDACQRLAEEAARHLGCSLVAVGWREPGKSACRLIGTSPGDAVAREVSLSERLEAALDEILIHDEQTVWPPESNAKRHGLLTHRQLVEQADCGGVIGAPLRDGDDNPIGAWLFCGDADFAANVDTQRFVDAASYRVGRSLSLVKRSQKPAWQRSISDVFHRGRTAPKRTVLAVTLLLGGVLAIPLPYQVEARSELQPVVRRFVAAPFDGTLDKALVEPGETVEAGQLLARMDDREINWELAGIEAEREQASLERNTNLAKQDIGAAEISRYDVERLELRRKLLSHRSDHLEIRSPIAGLVIAGDLQRSEGVPLRTGDSLFEIAPLDRMVIEVAIPEADIRHVHVGQDVELTLEAFPGEHWTGQLARVHPRSEIREQEHVFIGEVELQNVGHRLRPGMKGWSNVTTDRHSLGWILLHRPFEALLLRIGW